MERTSSWDMPVGHELLLHGRDLAGVHLGDQGLQPLPHVRRRLAVVQVQDHLLEGLDAHGLVVDQLAHGRLLGESPRTQYPTNSINYP